MPSRNQRVRAPSYGQVSATINLLTWPTAQRPHPPIWMGAGSENSIRRVAAQGFSLLLGQYVSPDDVAANIAVYRAEVEAHGRRFDPMQIGVTRHSLSPKTRQNARRCYSSEPYPYQEHPQIHSPDLRCLRPAALLLGHRHHPHAVLLPAVRDDVHRRTAVTPGPRQRSRHGAGHHRLARLEAPGITDFSSATLAVPAVQSIVRPGGCI